MAASGLLSRFSWRCNPIEVAAIVADIAPPEPPTHQEVIDQLDVDVVRQVQRMLELDDSFT